MGFSQHFPRQETFSQTRAQVGQAIALFTTLVKMDCYTNHFPCLPCFKKLTADKHVLVELPLVPFVIINLTRLTVGVCMKVRFKSKVTRGFSFSPLCDSLMALSCGEKSRKTSGTRVHLPSRANPQRNHISNPNISKGNLDFRFFSSPCGIGVLMLCSSYCIVFFFVTKFLLGCRFGNTFIFLLITKAILQLN